MILNAIVEKKVFQFNYKLQGVCMCCVYIFRVSNKRSTKQNAFLYMGIKIVQCHTCDYTLDSLGT